MTTTADFIELHTGMVVHVMLRESVLSAAFASVIRQVGEQGIHVDSPADGAGPALEPGSAVTLFVQSGGRIFRLESHVRLLESGEQTQGAMVLDHPVAADETERRQFYRLLTTITPRYASRVNATGDELERIDARILDLSGGGMQLHTREWVPVGSRIRLIFALDQDPQEVDTCVLGLSVVRPGPRRSLYRVHCRFVDLPRAERERLVRFIFRKQLDFRQRGISA